MGRIELPLTFPPAPSPNRIQLTSLKLSPLSRAELGSLPQTSPGAGGQDCGSMLSGKRPKKARPADPTCLALACGWPDVEAADYRDL